MFLSDELKCPVCDKSLLAVDAHGYIYCAAEHCFDRDYVSKLLSTACDPCQRFDDDNGWWIEHSLKCRRRGMQNCYVHLTSRLGDSEA